MVFAGIDPIYDPIPVRPGRPLPHGRRRHRRLGPHLARGALRRRRGRLHLGARRQPPRRQRADGDDHLRPPRRATTPPSAPSASTRREVPAVGARATPRRSCSALLDRSEGERPWRDPRRARRDACTRTSASSAARSRWRSRARSSRGLRERYERVVVEDKGEVFNNDLTQALELGFLLELAECMVVAGLRAQGEPRRPRAALRLPRARRRELPAPHARHVGGRAPASSTGGR